MSCASNADISLYCSCRASLAASSPSVSTDDVKRRLEALEKDHEFLLKGDVFTKDFIDAYLELKWEEVYALEHTPHPIEFQMYYSS